MSFLAFCMGTSWAQRKIFLDSAHHVASYKTAKYYMYMFPEDSAGNIIYKIYTMNDTLIKQESYLASNHEVRNGLFIEYHASGIPKHEVHFHNDSLEGIAKIWSDEGLLEAEVSYKNGKISGLQKEYDKGVLRQSWFSENEKRQGISQLFDDHGRLLEEWTYIDDIEEGPRKCYYPSGKLRKIENYKKGQRDGEVRRYHENGNLQMTRMFVNGRCIKEKCYDKKGKDTVCWNAPNGLLSHQQLIGWCKKKIIAMNCGNVPHEKHYKITISMTDKGKSYYVKSIPVLPLDLEKKVKLIVSGAPMSHINQDEDMMPVYTELQVNVVFK